MSKQQPADHNGEQWLDIRFLPASRKRGVCPPQPAGWYVVRTCPCHSGPLVTMPYGDPLRAEQAKRVLLAISGSG